RTDVADGHGACPSVGEQSGVPQVKGKLIGTLLTDIGGVFIGKDDVAQSEITEGGADGLVLVKLLIAHQVGQVDVVDQ
ncbi:hypothetical protein EG867_16940, partial [Enterococcus faecalis]